MININDCNFIVLNARKDDYIYLNHVNSATEVKKLLSDCNDLYRISANYTVPADTSVNYVSDFLKLFAEVTHDYFDYEFNLEDLGLRVTEILKILDSGEIRYVGALADRDTVTIYLTTEEGCCFSIWFVSGIVQYKFRHDVASFVDELSLNVFDSYAPEPDRNSYFYVWEV